MKKVLIVLFSVLICLSVGLTASLFQSDAIHSWYPTLNKPILTPPNIVFPIAWTVLYVCMGTSVSLIALTRSKKRNELLLIFGIQLFLNFAWSILFFYFRNPLAGFIDILLLDASVIIYLVKSYKVNRVSYYLFLPYIAWIAFATYLNGYILFNN